LTDGGKKEIDTGVKERGKDRSERGEKRTKTEMGDKQGWSVINSSVRGPLPLISETGATSILTVSVGSERCSLLPFFNNDGGAGVSVGRGGGEGEREKE
jgi:hypothetical protein